MASIRVPLFSAVLFSFAVSSLSGCTVLGVVADNAIYSEHERQRPIMEQGRVNPQDIGLFSNIGLEADIAIVKKVIATVKGEPDPAAKRCVMENGLRICYEEGAEGY